MINEVLNIFFVVLAEIEYFCFDKKLNIFMLIYSRPTEMDQLSGQCAALCRRLHNEIAYIVKIDYVHKTGLVCVLGRYLIKCTKIYDDVADAEIMKHDITNDLKVECKQLCDKLRKMTLDGYIRQREYFQYATDILYDLDAIISELDKARYTKSDNYKELTLATTCLSVPSFCIFFNVSVLMK